MVFLFIDGQQEDRDAQKLIGFVVPLEIPVAADRLGQHPARDTGLLHRFACR